MNNFKEDFQLVIDIVMVLLLGVMGAEIIFSIYMAHPIVISLILIYVIWLW